jgi:hypothetical protein
MTTEETTLAQETPSRVARVGSRPTLAVMAMQEAAVVGLGLALLHLLTLAGNYVEPDDGLGYASLIRQGDFNGISNPSHLLYGWLGWAAYQVALAFGSDAGPLRVLQVLDAICGAIGVAILWYVVRTSIGDRLVAILVCGLTAFSYGHWFYSVSAEVYALSTLLIIIALAFAYRAAMQPGAATFAVFGAANGLAVLGHTTNVLFAFVALAALLLAWQRLPGVAVARCGLAYAGAVCAVVLPAYALTIAVLGLDSPRDVYDWYTALAQSGNWGFWSSTTPLRGAIGAGRALVGGQFLFSIDGFRAFVESHLNWQPREELYLVRNLGERPARLIALFLVVVLAGLLALAARWVLRPALRANGRTLALLCVCWIVVYAPFIAWWEPVNVEFWIALWVPGAILLALPLSADSSTVWRRLRPFAVGSLLGALFLTNLFGSVVLQRGARDDYWRTRVSWYEENTTSSDVVLTSGYTWSSYMRYFSRAETIDVFEVFAEHGTDPDAAIEALVSRLRTVSSGHVYISSEVFYPDQDEFSCCVRSSTDSPISDRMRETLLGDSELVADFPLERVYEWDQR